MILNRSTTPTILAAVPAVPSVPPLQAEAVVLHLLLGHGLCFLVKYAKFVLHISFHKSGSRKVLIQKPEEVRVSIL